MLFLVGFRYVNCNRAAPKSCVVDGSGTFLKLLAMTPYNSPIASYKQPRGYVSMADFSQRPALLVGALGRTGFIVIFSIDFRVEITGKWIVGGSN
jgi:hypothetical protein